AQLAYLLKYDSVHGRFDGSVSVEQGKLIVNGQAIRVSQQRDPESLHWDAVGASYVLESSGFFTSKQAASRHLKGGAKKVVISAPSVDAPMFVMGVNHQDLSKEDLVFSNASCTTNCIAPIARGLHRQFGIEEAAVTTVHAATSAQSTVDRPLAKWRRGRSALNNSIPTTTSAGTAVTSIMPELKGRFAAMAVRVPTANVSLIDMTVKLQRPCSYEDIKKAMQRASVNEMKGILGYTEDEVVSQDFVSEPRTSVFDAAAGMEINPSFYKIIAWYDNEFGYATKIVDLIQYAASIS
ncbi:MAG: type I glyceraldehyde-3-phosphate dehydrogenase, partial [Lutibacter sp.]|nr:type I glyceraldehyde-3-phosphate dehydrogenase [Lutibacter sp.]